MVMSLYLIIMIIIFRGQEYYHGDVIIPYYNDHNIQRSGVLPW